MKKTLDDIFGHRWWFYVEEKNLLYNTDGGENCLLFEGVADEFDVVPDSLGHINIVAVTQSGDLVYLKYDFHSWSKYKVMESKSSSVAISSLKIFSISEKINLWYSYEYGGDSLLVHQIFQGHQMIGRINVIDLLGKRKCFDVCCDNDFNTHIVYVDENEKSI